ncbi:MAG TPA: Uma2 family endonuclease [Thermoanaerobaculia bacterium]|jgi:Uma2 family endonuclease|nr:Uma2 family endonuclease [Thermoanaerobaculia bacterium]
MATPAVDVHRWTREEYERMVEDGYFRPDERVELVNGIIYEMSPQKSWHAAAIQALQEFLGPVFKEGYNLRVQMPLALGLHSEPEPDVAVVQGHWRDYRDSHPSTAVLVIEVADTTLLYDREKSAVYARAEIPEYWIVNRIDGCLEVYREPRNEAYQSRTVLEAVASVSPLARPEASLRVGDFLP